MQGLAKSKSTADVDSKTTVSGAADTANSEGASESSTHENGEDEPPQTTSEKNKEGAAAPSAISGERATAPETTKQSTPSSDPAAADTPMPSGSGVSTTKTTTTAAGASPKDTNYGWVLQPSSVKGTHNIVWPSPQANLTRPSLVTGLTDLGQDSFIANVHEWKSEIESGDLEKYCSFLRGANLLERQSHGSCCNGKRLCP